MPKKTKSKLKGHRPSVRARDRGRTRASFKLRTRASFKPRKIPPKSKKPTTITEFVGQILDPKKNCNLFLIKYKYKKIDPKSGKNVIVDKYRFIENNKEINYTEKTIQNLEKIYSEECNILCKGIGKDFIDKSYLESEISVLQFSRIRTTKRVTKRVTTQVPKFSKRYYSLCGIICFNNLLDDMTHKNIYLDLICSRPGFGSNLLKIAEKTAKLLGKTCLFLRSVDHPLAFYIYKGYKFITSSDTIDLRNEPSFRPFFDNTTKELERKGRIPLRGSTVSLKNIISTKRNLSNVTILTGVKGDLENGIEMYKDLV